MTTTTIRGPISGGIRGRAFGASPVDLDALGYVEEEYFFSGIATAYSPTGELAPDGRWNVTPTGREEYSTRLLVRRPVDPSRFTGVVIVEWTNVTAGYESAQADVAGVYDAGYAHVAISAQDVGIHGFAARPQGLVVWDPQRYGGLHHPGDSYSYDIFGQGIHLVGPNRDDGGVDPMGGLTVRRVIATGASQSAMRLITYANAVTPFGHEVDGFLASLYVGSAYTFSNIRVDASNLLNATPEEQAAIFGMPSGVRDDLAVPFFLINTECESVTYAPVRQADTDVFRYWELAGAAHAPGPTMTDMAELAIREFGEYDISAGLIDQDLVPNSIDWRPVLLAAYGHLVRWIDDGVAPPVQPKLQLDEHGLVRRDERGNALGGARLPDIAAPAAAYDGGGVLPGTLGLSGETRAFSPEVLSSLYADHDAYVDAVHAAASAAVAAGVILPERADQYVSAAEGAAVPA